MNSQTSRQNIFKEYSFIHRNIEDDVIDLTNTAFRILRFGAQELLEKYNLSVKKNSEDIEESIDTLYFDVKNAFKNAVNFTAGRTNTQETGNRREPNKENNKQYEDAKIVYMLPEHISNAEIRNDLMYENVEAVKNKEEKNNYTSLLESIISKTNSAVNEVATVVAGKFCNSCSVKDRKPKRMWKWEDRINYVTGLFSDKSISEHEKEQMQEIRMALQKNSYLKYKKSEYYRQLDECLKQYT